MTKSGILLSAAIGAVLAAQPATAEPSYVVLAHPAAVDGRTIEDDHGRRYRLYAVDAPELAQDCLDPEGERYACGEASREALAAMTEGILSCDIVGIAPEAIKTVRCQDMLGYDIGSELISAGWALPDRASGQDYIFDEMEAEARARGLWQGRFVRPERWRAGARL
ncbi:thermonuclease family protein [Oricola sp.]|uniref:thermonuclease family protein n=1 Tax=Oricola sp. TaxID=1979950 RepID=UPI003BA8F178